MIDFDWNSYKPETHEILKKLGTQKNLMELGLFGARSNNGTSLHGILVTARNLSEQIGKPLPDCVDYIAKSLIFRFDTTVD